MEELELADEVDCRLEAELQEDIRPVAAGFVLFPRGLLASLLEERCDFGARVLKDSTI